MDQERQRLTQMVKTARIDLILMIALTVLNIILLYAGSDTMMLFSASLPYWGLILFSLLGLFPIGVALAAAVLLLYFLCWLLSRKNTVWITVAMTLLAVDTVFLIAMYIWMADFSGIIDLLIHGLLLYYLFAGVRAAKKLKQFPVEVEAELVEEVPDETE